LKIAHNEPIIVISLLMILKDVVLEDDI